MNASPTSAPAALLAVALLLATPLAAQDSAPLDIVPLPAPVAEPEAAEDTAPDGPAIEVGKVEEVAPEAVGLIERAEGGFAYDMWRGTDRRLVEALLPRLPVATTSPTMRGLARRLLLTTAAPPEGPRGADLVALRVERLAAMGDGVSMSHLLRAAPPAVGNVVAARAVLDAMLLTADHAGACAQANDLMLRDDDPYWEKVSIFCQALNGRHESAAFGLALLRERDIEEDAGFATLLAILAGDRGATLDSLRRPTPLHFAMLRQAGAPAPADAVATAPPAIVREIALSAAAPVELRLRAAERAESLGALPSETLANLYLGVPFAPNDVQDPRRRLAEDRGPLARALLFQAARIQVVQAARAEMLRAFWRLAREARGAEGFASAARVTVGDTLGLRPLPEMVAVSGDVARALYAAGRAEAAATWLELARSQAGFDAELATAVALLTPVAALASDDEADRWDAAGHADWRAAQGDVPAPLARRRAATLFALMSALDGTPGADVLLPLLDGPTVAWTKTPRPALLRQLGAAAADGRVGETVLMALVVLGDGEAGPPGPLALGAAVAALGQVGLAAAARALAVEVALADAL